MRGAGLNLLFRQFLCLASVLPRASSLELTKFMGTRDIVDRKLVIQCQQWPLNVFTVPGLPSGHACRLEACPFRPKQRLPVPAVVSNDMLQASGQWNLYRSQHRYIWLWSIYLDELLDRLTSLYVHWALLLLQPARQNRQFCMNNLR